MGKLNILPHKSWNVYSKKNIERVRRDEEQAINDERCDEEKVRLRESESMRLTLIQRSLSARNDLNIDNSEHLNYRQQLQSFDDVKSSPKPAFSPLGERLHKKCSTPWYALVDKTTDVPNDPKIKKRISSLDPMSHYYKLNSKKFAQDSAKRRAADEDDTSYVLKAGSRKLPSLKNTDNLSELRAQRIEREKRERSRQHKLIAKEEHGRPS